MMTQLPVGTVHTMRITEKKNEGLLLTKGTMNALLPIHDENYEIDDFIDVFLYTNKEQKLLATTEIPDVVVGVYNWVEVVDVIPHLGVFITIGIDEDVLIFNDDLTMFKSVLSNIGDKI